MEKGYLTLVLHAHLPFVRHPEHEHFLEENWLFEAMTETYLPLLQVFEGLHGSGVHWNLTLSVTPTLANMLRDPLLQDRYERHLNNLIELAGKEVERTRWQPEFQKLALFYHHRFVCARERFHAYGRDLTRGFKKFQEFGHLEIITCAATHGFLPLMNGNRAAARAQIRVGAQDYERVFGRRPRGIWLPECGYESGLDEILRDEGIEYFITDAHGVLHATPRPVYGIFAPLICPSGVAAFGRDLESSRQVWSAKEGYPGDPEYREYYRDIGWDLEYEYVAPYLRAHAGNRGNTGIKYYKITGKTAHKEPYDFNRANEKAAIHAGNFMFNREKQIEHLHGFLERAPILVAPYDAELFGHWWFEGPEFLNYLLRKIYYDQNTIQTITPSEYLKRFPTQQVATPSMSSWGYKGYNEVWLNGTNDWIYPHLHKAAEQMAELARRHSTLNGNEPLIERALNQAARELLLAQSSDWAFIMNAGTTVEYAHKRTQEHLDRFHVLRQAIDRGEINSEYLSRIEQADNLFPHLDYRVYG